MNIEQVVEKAIGLIETGLVTIVTDPKARAEEPSIGVEWVGAGMPTLSIDPQHEHVDAAKAAPVSACKYVLERRERMLGSIQLLELIPAPDRPIKVYTSKLDADAGTAIALVLALLAAQEDSFVLFDHENTKKVVDQIDLVDTGAFFAAKEWAPNPLPVHSLEALEGELIRPARPSNPLESTIAPLAMALVDQKAPLTERIRTVYEVLLGGMDHPALRRYREQYEADRKALAKLIYEFVHSGTMTDAEIDAVLSSNSQIFDKFPMIIGVLLRSEGVIAMHPVLLNQTNALQAAFSGNAAVAFGVGTHRGMTGILYRMAPIIVACNPRWDFKGTTGTKYTIARYNDRVPIDLRLVMEALNAKEPGGGWGGQPNIIGSPMGQPSALTLETVLSVVVQHVQLDKLNALFEGTQS